MKISLVCMPGHDDAGQEYARAVALQGLRIDAGLLGSGVQADAQRFEEFQIRPIAGHGKNKIVRELFGALGRLDLHGLGMDRDQVRIEVRLHLAALDPVLDVRLDPILHAIRDPRAAMKHRDARAGPKQFQRRDGRRILRAHDQHVVIVVRMRLLVIVDHFVQLFAGDVQHVGNVVVAGGENDLAGADIRSCWL